MSIKPRCTKSSPKGIRRWCFASTVPNSVEDNKPSATHTFPNGTEGYSFFWVSKHLASCSWLNSPSRTRSPPIVVFAERCCCTDKSLSDQVRNAGHPRLHSGNDTKGALIRNINPAP